MYQLNVVIIAILLCASTIIGRAQPVIDPAPASATVCPGNSVTFSATATGDTDPLLYQWYFNDTIAITGATNSSYSISSVSATDAGAYTVVVTDNTGSTTSAPPAVLTVNAPTTATGPSDQVVNQGQPATFTTTAGGTGPFTYTWRYGATLLDGPGANNSYTIASAQAADAGTYSVEVQGACNTVTNSANLTVIIPPSITQQPQSITRTNGGGASFTVVASGSTPSYQWRVGGVNISGANSSTYSIASVSPGQAGSYDVVVSNAAGSATSDPAVLTVLVPAGIDTQPVSLVRTQGMSATFSVVAFGDAPIAYQWRLNGNNIAGANSSSYTIPSVRTSDAGAYTVVVSNGSGSSTSSAANLTVLTPRSAIYVDFNAINDFTNNFGGRLFNSGNAATFGEFPSGGVANTRALRMERSNNDGQTLTYLNESYDFTQIGTVLNIAISIKATNATATGLPSLQLGFVNETNAYFTGDNPAAFMSARVGCQTLPLTWSLEQQTKLLGAGAITANNVGGGAITAGNWYRFKVTLTKTAATQYTVSATLQDMGATGTTPGANVLVLNSGTPVTVTNPDITADSSVWPAFRYSDQRGLNFLDDLAAWGSSGAVTLTQEPVDQTVEANRSVTFSAKVDGLGPYTFQWSRGGSPIPGATSRSYTFLATMADNGAQFSFSSGSATSSNATLTVTADTTAPTVVSAGSLNGSKVGVAFSEQLLSATAINPANYTVSGGVVSSVVLRPDGKSVELTLSTPTTGNFTVTASGVQDLAGNPVSGSANSAAANVAGLLAFDVSGPEGIPPLAAGSTFTSKDGEFDVVAGGADLWNTADDGHLILGPRTGDFDFRVRVQSFTRQMYMSTVGSRDDFTKATLTARASLSASAAAVQGSLFPELVGLPSGRNFWEYGFRTAGGTMAQIPGANNFANAWTGGANNFYTTPRANPVNWGRLRRYNDTFTYYVSSNGVNWIQTAQIYQPMGNTLQVGLGLTSHFDAANYKSATELRNFSDVSFPGSTITVTAINPTPTNVPAFATATFTVSASVAGAAASELQYQWQRSDGLGGFTNVPGAPLTASYTTPVLFESDSGSQWRAIVKVTGATAVTSPAATANIFDTAAPTIVNASAPTGSVQHVLITFSEPVGVGSADVLGNYTLTNSSGTVIPLTSAAFAIDTRTILLGASAPLTAGSYGIVVNNVRDRATTPNTIAANSSRVFSIAVTTGNPALVEIFTGISGTAVANLTNDVKFLNQTPDNVIYTNIFAWIQNLPSPGFADNYGDRITSYFVAPSNGIYRFFIRSDDLSALWMNTNNVNSTDRSQKALIAQQSTACCKNYGDTSGGPNVSVNIPLNAGQRYYIEALHKEGGGGDGFTMMFREAGVVGSPANTEVTAAAFLELPTGPMAVASITPSSATVAENSTLTFTVSGVTGAGPTKFQWLKNGVPIPGAIGFSYTTPPLGLTDTAFSFAASNLFSTALATANITVQADLTAPTIAAVAASPTLSDVTVTFSERVSVATAQNVANYSIAGLTVLSATLDASGTAVKLHTSAQSEGAPYTLVVNNIQDRAGTPNTIAADTTVNFHALVFAGGLTKVELFTGIAGNNVSDLTSSAKYIANTPDASFNTNRFMFTHRAYNSFVTLANTTLDNYGTRITGWFLAPSNGNYRFFIRSDDMSQLSMNTNAVDGSDPAGKVLIAQQSTACCKNYGDTSGGPNVSVPVSLIGGRRYFLEALQKEGTGGDGFVMAWREAGVPGNPPNNEWAPPEFFQATGNPDLPGAPAIQITQQPAAVPDITEYRTASFTVVAANSLGALQGYQWQKNGADIPGATQPTYTTPPLSQGDSGSAFRVKIATPGVGAIAYSDPVTVTVVPDTEGPRVVAVYGDPIANHLRVVFDETIAASSLNPDFFMFSGGQVPTNATLLPDGKSVLLILDGAIGPASDYVVDTSNIQDLAGNYLVEGHSNPFTAPWLVTNGVVLRELFLNNVGPNSFQTVSNNPFFPSSPSVSDYITSFNSPQSSPDLNNYSTRITGFILPPVSGNYIFRIHSDDSGMLMLSGDAGTENKRTLLRAEGDCGGCSNPLNVYGPVTLTAGNAYYIEALAQEGTGGDYIDVGWIVPGTGGVTNIIPGVNLAYAVNPDAITLQITTQPVSTTVVERRTATFVAGVTASGPATYQWQVFNFISFTWDNIPGATNTTFRYRPTDSLVEDGTMFRFVASLSGGLVTRTAISDEVMLTVEDDSTGPTAIRAYSLSGTTIKIIFDEDLDLLGATDAPWYAVDGGVNVTHVDLFPDNAGVSNTVLLTLDAPLPSASFNVSGNIPDGGGNMGAFSLSGTVFALGAGLIDDGPIGTAADPLEKGSTAVDPNSLEVVAGGSDIWGNADGFRYAYGTYSGNFDVKVRVSSLDARNKWSKAGIIVREDLTPNAHNLSAVVTPSAPAALDGSGAGANDYEAGNRATVGAATTDWGQFRPTPVPYPDAWIRMQRVGDTFTAYWANNGINWTQFATITQVFPSTVYMGLGTTAHNNGAGQVTTAVYHDFARLLPPTIEVPPQSQTVLPNAPATFNVTVSGEAPFTYQWRFNGSPILGETNPSLAIAATQPSDAGSYDVIVSNVVGSATSAAAVLTIAAPPVIVTQPIAQTIECHANGTTTFSVTAIGDAPLTYQWYFNDTTLLIDETNSTLTLLNINLTPASSGSYKVIVTNPAGSTGSDNALLTVVDTIAPTFTCLGDLAVCSSSNSAIVTFTTPVALDMCDGAVHVVASPASGSSFAIGDTTVTLTATDGAGNSSSCHFTVSVTQAVAPALTVIDYAAGTFRFSFPSQNHCTYLIQYKNSLDDTEWTTLRTVPGTDSIVTVEDDAGEVTTRFYQVTVQ